MGNLLQEEREYNPSSKPNPNSPIYKKEYARLVLRVSQLEGELELLKLAMQSVTKNN